MLFFTGGKIVLKRVHFIFGFPLFWKDRGQGVTDGVNRDKSTKNKVKV
jgi:hypothetical protein